MIRILRHGATEAEGTETDRKIRAGVDAGLEDVGARGDAAVRELSAKQAAHYTGGLRVRKLSKTVTCRRVSPEATATI